MMKMGVNNPFFDNPSVYLRQDNLTIIVETVSERHAPPSHANECWHD